LSGTTLKRRGSAENGDLSGGSRKPEFAKGGAPGQVVNAIDFFLMLLQSKNRSANTLRNYKQTLERWRSVVSERGVTDVTQYTMAHHAVYLTELQARGLKGTTIDLANALVRNFTNFCYEQGLVQRDPLLGFDRNGSEKPLPKPLPWEMVEEHIARIKGRYTLAVARDKLLVRLMAYTALRVGEALALKRTDLNLELRQLTLEGTKGKEAYQHPFPTKLVPYLEEWVTTAYRQWPTSVWLFPSRTGGRLQPREVQKAFKRYGIASPHTYRHTNLTYLMELTGGDLKAVQEMARHKDIKSTMKYLKLWDVKKRAVADLIK